MRAEPVNSYNNTAHLIQQFSRGGGQAIVCMKDFIGRNTSRMRAPATDPFWCSFHIVIANV